LIAYLTMTTALNTTAMESAIIDTIPDSTIQSLIARIALAMSLYTSTPIITIVKTLSTFTSLTCVTSTALAKGHLIIGSNTHSLPIAILRTVFERTVLSIIGLVTSALVGGQVTYSMSRTVIQAGPLGTVGSFESRVTLASA